MSKAKYISSDTSPGLMGDALEQEYQAYLREFARAHEPARSVQRHRSPERTSRGGALGFMGDQTIDWTMIDPQIARPLGGLAALLYSGDAGASDATSEIVPALRAIDEANVKGMQNMVGDAFPVQDHGPVDVMQAKNALFELAYQNKLNRSPTQRERMGYSLLGPYLRAYNQPTP